MADTDNISNPVKDLAKRFLLTFFLGVVVYRLGCFVPIPDVDVKALQDLIGDNSVLAYANMFNGGAIMNASIFGLGIMPYITASIIFQLLAYSFPAIKEMQKEGEVGRRKINQYTRYLTVGICFVQAVIAALALSADGAKSDSGLSIVSAENRFLFVAQSAMIITTGSMALLWLAEQITRHGIGNGVSVIIMIGILSTFPAGISEMTSGQDADLLKFFAVLAIFIAVIAGMVMITTARRRIQLEQQRRVQGNKVYGGQQTSVPLMLNHANVIPVIFASPIMVVLSMAAGWAGLTGLVDYGTAGYRYIFIGLIIFFTYFYISITMDLNDMANHFKQGGFFIRGVRPGKKTVEYLQYRLHRITFVGAISLAAIAVIPEMLGGAVGLTMNTSQALLGGIGLLIVVGVTLDVIQKVSAFLMAGRYQNMMQQGGGGKPGKGKALSTTTAAKRF